MAVWAVLINGGILLIGVLSVAYEHGRNRGIILQIDKRLSRIEDYIFNGKGGK